jgi:hypothetical protein
MKKLNIKRAFKALVKNGEGTIYYLAFNNGNYLVGNAHCIITVSESDFHDNFDVINTNKVRLENSECLLDVARKCAEHLDTEYMKPTTVSIMVGTTETQVLKTSRTKRLTVVNKEYMQCLEDAGSTMLHVSKRETSIKEPLFEMLTNEKQELVKFFCVLPINCDVVNVLNDVLSM